MHPIKYAAKQSGLSAHVIRVWERRYAAITPSRTATNRRIYSDDDIARLTLLRRASAAGHNIGQLVTMSAEQLHQIAGTTPPIAQGPPKLALAKPISSVLDKCIVAARKLDGAVLDELLANAAAAYSQVVVIEQLIVPLMERIGDLWSDGKLRPAHEHLASAIVRSFVANIVGAYQPNESAPRLVVTTPAGQWHEIGALLATATASADGWRTTYLGPNLPADEIAGAALQNEAQVVALSIVYPGDDPNVNRELQKLRRALPAGVKLLIGGRSAQRYQKTISAIGAIQIEDLAHLRRQLGEIRG